MNIPYTNQVLSQQTNFWRPWRLNTVTYLHGVFLISHIQIILYNWLFIFDAIFFHRNLYLIYVYKCQNKIENFKIPATSLSFNQETFWVPNSWRPTGENLQELRATCSYLTIFPPGRVGGTLANIAKCSK